MAEDVAAPDTRPPTRAQRLRDRFRPRLRTVLVAVNMLVLVLPVAGIGVLRLYESELVRRTEAELIGQAALVAESYAQAVRGAQTQGVGDGTPFGSPVRNQRAARRLLARQPQLDRSTTDVLPDTPLAERRAGGDHPVAVAAGQALGDLLVRATRTTLSAIRIVGPHGYVVATSRGAQGRYLGTWPEVERGLGGEATSFLRRRHTSHVAPSLRSVSRGTPVRVFVGHPVVVRGQVWGVVVLSRTPLDVIKALYLNRHELVGGLVVLLLVVGLVAFLTSRLIARPLRDLRAQAERVASGDRAAVARIPHAGTREVAALSEALAAMATSLQGRAAYLEAFAQNVSHAFKTPLTTIRGTVELLQDHVQDMDAAQRARFLDNLAAEAARLDRLVRRLMVLARADVLDPAHERADVGEVVRSVEVRAAARGEVVTHVQADLPPVMASPETLDALVDNLVDNALKHGDAPVRVTAEARGETVAITVHDSGPGVDAEVADKLFAPFVTTAGSTGGTGLGLAIVRALAQAHGGDVRTRPADRGACFEVTLPVAR